MKHGPSVLWIVSDHQVHATRPPDITRFPLQDRLARRGVEFTRAHTVLPVCSPARASMLTGLYPHAISGSHSRVSGTRGMTHRERSGRALRMKAFIYNYSTAGAQ
ncbi:MAG: sulfatase-like hydrolase/transferase [Gammaproteobacteria bacterium]|nr:sulfatase-like hydrolase/transferase [Gammaproteobacteria bacterium]